MITKEQYKILDKHISTIKTIVVNQAFSNVTISFREDMVKVGKELGYNFCSTCNSGLYNLVTHLYNKYIEYKNNIKKNGKTVQSKSGQESSSKRS